MFANSGKRKATLIDRIQDRWGNTIYKHDERICEGCDAQAHGTISLSRTWSTNANK